MPNFPDDPEDVAAWDERGLPHSPEHGDIYFSAEDGLAESRAVFLDGCGLPGAWTERRSFCVAELGFGTGLNIAALIDLWRRSGPPGARLHVFTLEQRPLTAREADRALGRWPELASVSRALVTQWPPRTRGFHRIDLPEWRVVIDIAHLEAEEALTEWGGRADAWFLDGFAPAADPAIWREAVLALVAARSAPGARAASFTVAGRVRRGLADVGFTVERRPGHGRKKERLEARAPGTPTEAGRPSVAIVGAGIAGASLARAFQALGIEPVVFDLAGRGGGASGAPAVLTTPRLDAGLGDPARLFAQALARARQLYASVPEAILAQGVVQLAREPRDDGRFARIAGSGIFGPDGFILLSPEQAQARLGEAAEGAVLIADAAALDPAAVLAAWAPQVQRRAVAAAQPQGEGWRLTLDDGTWTECDIVCLAAGPASVDLIADAPLTPVRGQACVVAGQSAPAVSFGGYAAPTRSGVVFGATHARGDSETRPRPADAAQNRLRLQAALPQLARRLEAHEASSFVAVRAATPDTLPLAGPWRGPGLHLLTGLGSRGFCLAPLLADHVAALALGAPSPLPATLARLVDPQRFAADLPKARLDGSQGALAPFRQGSGRPS